MKDYIEDTFDDIESDIYGVLGRINALRMDIHGTPSKPWVSLTDDEIDGFRSGYQSGRIGTFVELTRAIEAALRSKNNG